MGEHRSDQITKQFSNRRLAQLVPKARFGFAEQSGHNIHQNQPEMVTETIRRVVEVVRDPSPWQS